MLDVNPTLINACLVIEGIAFEVVKNSDEKRIFVTDINNPCHRASFVVRGRDLVLSVSSFREKPREKAMLEAVRINNALLLDEVHYPKAGRQKFG